MVNTFHPKTENAVASRGCHIEFVATVDAVAESIAKELHKLLIGLTLEDKQILN